MRCVSEKIRLERRGGYTHMPNELIWDKRLSCKTKGVMLVMFSCGPDWSYTVAGMARACNMGRDAMRSALRELEEAGYLERRQTHGEDGTFAGNEYIIRDYAVPPEEAPEPPADTVAGKPDSGAVAGKSADGSPADGKPDATIINLNNNIPPIVPHGDGGGEDRPPAKKPRGRGKRTAYEPEWFERLWQLYPRQDAKEDARRAWDKLRPSRELCREMSMGLARQAASPKWQEEGGRYIPLLSTWLNGRRWRDQGVVLPQGTDSPTPTLTAREEVPTW